MELDTFEAWYDLADSSISLTSEKEVQRLKTAGGWLTNPVFLHRIKAPSLEEAIALHEKAMDWDRFHERKDLIATCHSCGVCYFPKLSAFCPHCNAGSA